MPRHLHPLPRNPIYTLPQTNLHRSSQNDVVFGMRFVLSRDLKRSSVCNSISAVRCLRSREPLTMATKEEEKPKENATEKATKTEKEEKQLPPPPEKPEPGDCCGSGCVRCVWDVYYEELEAYDKLLKSVSGESKS